MAHMTENLNELNIKTIILHNIDEISTQVEEIRDVCILILPPNTMDEPDYRLKNLDIIADIISPKIHNNSTLVVIGETIDLIGFHKKIYYRLRYQLFIAIKRSPSVINKNPYIIPNQYIGAMVYTKYKSPLRHKKTRIKYSYCPNCDKTTKDYGGKKHVYHNYGTLMSDVWRDFSCNLDDNIDSVINRFADLFGLECYNDLIVIDCRLLTMPRQKIDLLIPDNKSPNTNFESRYESKLIRGDALEELKKIPDNSIDFTFADPPYNLNKKYTGYEDDLNISKYFKWCDKWISELARVLRPGRTCAILNIPLWAIRHFIHMEKFMKFQNWIVWDALSFPVRMIMPAHYSILCFSKGASRKLPGLYEPNHIDYQNLSLPKGILPLEPLADDYCLRAKCIKERQLRNINDRKTLTDLWWDIHRLKHNSRRVNHPCQLPPALMYRLILIFTEEGDIVLDCFNGAGTTSLTAQQLGRKFIGIEMSDEYHKLALIRHKELSMGFNPFRKEKRELTAKNSRVPRLTKKKYKVPKKTLQLEVKRIADKLGKLPSRDDVIKMSKYPIDYYDSYFISWGEVCAAARNTGMREDRYPPGKTKKREVEQIEIFDYISE